jgi:hypothetical protein
MLGIMFPVVFCGVCQADIANRSRELPVALCPLRRPNDLYGGTQTT